MVCAFMSTDMSQVWTSTVDAGVHATQRWGTALPQRPGSITQCLVTRDPRKKTLLNTSGPVMRCRRVGNQRAWAVQQVD